MKTPRLILSVGLWSMVMLPFIVGGMACKDTPPPVDGGHGDGDETLCNPGQIFCVMGEARVCLPDGKSWSLLGDCFASGGICVPGVGCEVMSATDTGVHDLDTGVELDASLTDWDTSVDGGPDTHPDSGADHLCRPGERTCDGDQVKFCLGGTEWADGADCTATDQKCKDGVCVGCTPGEKFCIGASSVALCEDDGETVTMVGECSEGRACHGGACVGQCGADNQKLSYMGCEYWAVDLENLAHPHTQFAVAVSNVHPQDQVVVKVYTASLDEDGDLVENQVAERTINPGGLEIIALPSTNQVKSASKGLKAFRILADAPVIAYQFNPLNNTEEAFSNDASLLLPSQALDKEYVAISGDATTGNGGGNWGAYVSVVGVSEFETNVRITVPPGVTFTAPGDATVTGQVVEATVGLFEVLTVTSTSVNYNVAGNGNMSGAWVTADSTVAVFAGNAGSQVPTGPQGTCCADHLEAQLLPVSTWGKNHVCGASYQRRRGVGAKIPDYWRVVAAEDHTNITYVPHRPAGAPQVLSKGQSVEFGAVDSFIVMADKPVSMMQFLVSSYQADPTIDYVDELPPCGSETPGQDAYCTSSTGYLANCTGFFNQNTWSTDYYCTPLGDPAMMPVPPVEQFRKEYVFLTPLDYQMDFITVVAPSTAQVKLDGNPIGSSWVNIGAMEGKTWSTQAIQVSPGVHTLTSTEPVGLMVYGIDRDVSYGYAAGLDLDKIYSR